MNNKTVVVISTYKLLINQRLYFKSLFGLSTTLDNSSYNYEFGIFFFLHYFLSFSLIVWCIMCPRIRSDQMYMRLKGSDLDQMINVELKGVWGNVISAGQGGLDCAERCQKWDEQILTGLSYLLSTEPFLLSLFWTSDHSCLFSPFYQTFYFETVERA